MERRRRGDSLALNAESFVPNWELTQLLDIFPLPLRQALVRLPNLDSVIEVVLDLGRPPEARFDDDFVFLGETRSRTKTSPTSPPGSRRSAATIAPASSRRCTASARSATAPERSSA